MLEDILFEIGYVCIGCLGAFQFIRAIYKLRVLICSFVWPTTDATLRQSRVLFEETQSVRSGPADHLDHSYYHSVDEGLFYTKMTTRWYYPLLRFEYEYRKQTITTDNLAPYNRKFFYFGEDHAKTIIEKYDRRRVFRIRYNPHKAGEVFLGAWHFPYFITTIQAIAGWFFALSFSITTETILKQLNIIEPTIGDRPISIFVITALLFGYGFLRIAVGLLKGGKRP